MRRVLVVVTPLLALAAAGGSFAQQSHQHGQTPHAQPPSAADGREWVPMPAPMVERTLANMRDHLAALQDIAEHLGMGHFDVAAQVAEQRLGMSSLGLHGAHEVASYMPAGMQAAGSAMHRAASQFAVVAKDAAVTGEPLPVFAGLARITSACVACHAGYRFQ